MTAMTYKVNPFPEADGDRHAIWDMLMRRDFEAFLAQNWSMVAGDFIAEGFFGLHAHGQSNPDSWKLGFPTLSAYRDEWLRQSAETAATEFAEPLGDALYRVASLRDIDIGDGVAVARKKFDGHLAKADGTSERVNWQTLYLCARRDGVWKISSFIGYMPHPMGG